MDVRRTSVPLNRQSDEFRPDGFGHQPKDTWKGGIRLPPHRDTVFTLSTACQQDFNFKKRNECTFGNSGKKGNIEMFHFALIFLVIAVTSAIFGFGGIAVSIAGVAKLLFYIFISLFTFTLLAPAR